MLQEPPCVLLYHKLKNICDDSWSVAQEDNGDIHCSQMIHPEKHIYIRPRYQEDETIRSVIVSVTIDQTQYVQNFSGQMQAYEYLEDYIGVEYNDWPTHNEHINPTISSTDKLLTTTDIQTRESSLLGKRKREEA